MLKKNLWLLLVLLLALAVAVPASAANSIAFETTSLKLFEGESLETALIRDGAAAEGGEVTYTIANGKIASVSDEGIVSGISKGNTSVTATLKIDNKTYTAKASVQVLRKVSDVALKTANLSVYDAGDPAISSYLTEVTDNNVLTLLVGKSIQLSATVEPNDASNRKVTFTSSDSSIARVNGTTLVGKQAGECLLTVASESNPEVNEVWHVLVMQPVTKVTVYSDIKSVRVGEVLQLYAEFAPENATMQVVTWTSQNSKIASVDEFGVVTGLARGEASIVAKAADGSGKSATYKVTVTQPAEEVTLKQTNINLVAGKTTQLTATVYPSNASDKTVTWSSSDESIATVSKGGVVKGISRGSCVITATSNSDPQFSADCTVNVIQQVTGIVFSEKSISLPVHTTAQVQWTVLPDDASIADVVLSSSNTKVATVDEDGTITAKSRGTCTITAKATDGSNKTGKITVKVTQPVEGVSIQYDVYHIQLKSYRGVYAVLEPSNADITQMTWASDDDYIALPKYDFTEKASVSVKGLHEGTTILTGTTVDGGFSASTEIRVADFNNAVVCRDLWVENDSIKIVLKNVSDFTVDKVWFQIEVFNAYGEAMICNTDGSSTFFTGYYPYTLESGEKSTHGRFVFENYLPANEQIGGLRLTITKWRDDEEYSWKFADDADRPTYEWGYVPQ